jgi:hypothetical protein
LKISEDNAGARRRQRRHRSFACAILAPLSFSRNASAARRLEPARIQPWRGSRKRAWMARSRRCVLKISVDSVDTGRGVTTRSSLNRSPDFRRVAFFQL